MKSYRVSLKPYLQALAARQPAPGGGSAAVLSLCMGISLIEKAMQYSSSHSKRLCRLIVMLQVLRKNSLQYIDLDGVVFEQFIRAEKKRKAIFLKKSDALIVTVGMTCRKVYVLTEKVESDIKKSIISDFYLGLAFVRVALCGCVHNLEANSVFTGKVNPAMVVFRRYLKQWQRS
ncbi:MAG: cyclodeaminase/cyclohydrolase family protein [Candidatus Omnitrophota bacterium]